MKPIVDWIAANPSLSVGVNLGFLALVVAILSGTAALFVKPKLKELEDVRTSMAAIEPLAERGVKAADSVADLLPRIAVLEAGLNDIKEKQYSSAINQLVGRVGTLEVLKDGERNLLELRLRLMQESVDKALSGMDALQSRSEAEIERIQNESQGVIEKLRNDSRDNLVRLGTLEQLRIAREQAEQDLQLAQIREQLARLSASGHPEAVARVVAAQARLEALSVQANTAAI